jgi:hypothetical protein
MEEQKNRKKRTESAFRNLLISQYDSDSVAFLPREDQIDNAVQKFLEGRLKIWYSDGWLTFIESTEPFKE